MIGRRAGAAELAVLGLVTLMASCRSAPTRLFTLEPIAGVSGIGRYSGPALRIDAVHIPPSLDRIAITTDLTPGELRINELDHWAAPPGQLVRQALTADLDILAFSADAQGARLEASWIMTSDDSNPGSGGRTASLEDVTPTAGAAATARAWSTMLARLADRIAGDLTAGAQ